MTLPERDIWKTYGARMDHAMARLTRSTIPEYNDCIDVFLEILRIHHEAQRSHKNEDMSSSERESYTSEIIQRHVDVTHHIVETIKDFYAPQLFAFLATVISSNEMRGLNRDSTKRPEPNDIMMLGTLAAFAEQEMRKIVREYTKVNVALRKKGFRPIQKK